MGLARGKSEEAEEEEEEREKEEAEEEKEAQERKGYPPRLRDGLRDAHLRGGRSSASLAHRRWRAPRV